MVEGREPASRSNASLLLCPLAQEEPPVSGPEPGGSGLAGSELLSRGTPPECQLCK